jgi:hypothetical protein
LSLCTVGLLGSLRALEGGTGFLAVGAEVEPVVMISYLSDTLNEFDIKRATQKM